MKEDIFKKHKEATGTAKKIYSRFLDKVIGPAISIALHLALLAVLSFIVFYRPSPPAPKFSIIKMGKIKIPEMKTELSSSEEETTQNSDSSSDQASASSASADSTLQVTSTSPPGNIFESSQGSSLSAFDGGFMSLGDSMVAKGVGNGNPFGHRGGGRGKSDKRDKEVEKALLKALRWLKNTQNKDGSWGDGFNFDIRNAISSLAVLTFLAHGDTTSSPEFGKTVENGLKNLLKKSGGYGRKGFKGSFGEALLTYVLAEGATMTKVPELLDRTKMRTILICKKLAQQSSWRTGSRSAWNYQALKAAVFATSYEEFNKAAIKSAKSLLAQHTTQSNHTFSTRSRIKDVSELDDIFARSYCLQLFGYTRHPTVRKNLSLAERANRKQMLRCNWEKPPRWPLYCWYYRTNALFFSSSGGSRNWRKWYINFTDVLLVKQQDDGSFYSPEATCRSDEEGETVQTFGTEKDLTTYSTTMCALMMQTKYRYLPSYCSKPQTQNSAEIVFSNPEVEKEIGISKIFKEFKIHD